jgi:hypothetical protein
VPDATALAVRADKAILNAAVASATVAAVVEVNAAPAASHVAATGAAPKAAPVASSAPPPADASLGDTLGQLLHVDADAARASLTGELGPVFEHGGVCFCGAA